VTTTKLGGVEALTGLDGKILPDGNVKIYDLSGEKTVFEKMQTDFSLIGKNLNDLATEKSGRKIVPLPTEKFYDDENCFNIKNEEIPYVDFFDEDKRFYTLLSQTFTNKDKYELLFIEFISTPEVEAISGAREELIKSFDKLRDEYIEVYGYEKNLIKEDTEDNKFIELKSFKLDETTNRRLIYKTQPLNSNDSLSKDKKTQITQIYGQTNWNNKKETFDGKVKLN
jgi:hypothetical protein